MKKSLIYLFSLLCMLTLVTSCSDDEKGGTDDAWKEISKEYTSGITANGLSTSGTVNVNAASADKATIILNNMVAGESSVSVDATLKKTDTGYAFEGESTATTCNVKVSGTIELGANDKEDKVNISINRTLTSALAGTMDLNFISGESLMAQTYFEINTGNTEQDAILKGMATSFLGQLIAQQVESVSVNLGEDGIFSFSFKKVGSSETTVMPPANLAAMINSYLTWFEKDDVLYLAVHKDALTILGGLDILPEGMELESIVNILSLDGDFYTIPVNTIKEDNLVTVFLGKAMITKVWALAKPLIEKIPDENLQSIVNVVGGVMDTAQDIKVGLVFKK